MATATAPTTDLTDLTWPTGPIEREINHELDHAEAVAALRDARDALARRRS